MKIDPASRFWPKVDKCAPDECWPWKASVSGGYGVFAPNGGRVQASAEGDVVAMFRANEALKGWEA